VVAPAALLHPCVPQPDGTVLYELVTGHPDRAPRELVFLADLTVELRAWPADTWAKVGVDPQAAAGAVVAGWQRADLLGLRLGGLSDEEALALERPAMTLVAPSSTTGSAARSARRTCGGCIPPADAGQATGSCSSGHPQGAAVSTVDNVVRTPGRGAAAVRTPDTAAAVHTAAAGHGRRSCFRAGGWGRLCRAAPIMLTSLGGGRDLWQQRSRAPRPAAHRASCHVHGGYGTGHHVSALAARIWWSTGHFVRGGRPAAARAWLPTSAWPRVRTPSVRRPSVRTAVVPEAADSQSADRRKLWSITCLSRGGVMPDPMTDDERVQLEHRWAVRVSLPPPPDQAGQ
jgi:hypothetical protein